MSTTASEFKRLIAQVRDGSEVAARKLHDEYGPQVQAVVRRRLHKIMRSRLESIDVMQLIWVSFFADRNAIGRFTSPAQLIAYLAGMAQNKVADQFARMMAKKRGFARECSLERDVTASKAPRWSGPTPSTVASTKEEHLAVMASAADPQDLRILELRGSGATCDEIAEQLGMSPRTVRGRLQRLIERFQS